MDPDLLIAALGSIPHDPSCFLCGNQDHLAPSCPWLDVIRQDAFKSCLILKLLNPKSPKGAPHGNNPLQCVCALTDSLSGADDIHSDDSTVVHDNTTSDDDAFAWPAPDFLVSPPIDLHLSIGEGQPDVCGGASGGGTVSGPPLPSTGESGPGALPSGVTLPIPPLSTAPDPGLPVPTFGSMPINLTFQIEFLDFLNLQVASMLEDYFAS